MLSAHIFSEMFLLVVFLLASIHADLIMEPSKDSLLIKTNVEFFQSSLFPLFIAPDQEIIVFEMVEWISL
jgi:hypothetical protein